MQTQFLDDTQKIFFLLKKNVMIKNKKEPTVDGKTYIVQASEKPREEV